MSEQPPVCPYCDAEMEATEGGTWKKMCDCEDAAPIKNWQLRQLEKDLDEQVDGFDECTTCGLLFDVKDERADIGPPHDADALPTHALCPGCALEEHRVSLSDEAVQLLEHLGAMTGFDINVVLGNAIREYTDRQLEIAKGKIEQYELQKQIRAMAPEINKGYMEIARLRKEIEELKN